MDTFEHVRDTVWATRHEPIDEVAAHLRISHGSAHEITHDKPQLLLWSMRGMFRNSLQKNTNIMWKSCQQLLNQYCDHGDAFLRCITTGNKTWIQHFQLESKHQSLKWKHLTSLVRMMVRTQATPGKTMFTIFWDAQGTTVEYYVDRGSTVNSAYYCQMLQDILKPAIHSKCQRLRWAAAVLLHYPHSAATLFKCFTNPSLQF